MAIDLVKFENILNHQFSDPDLARLALTHRSAHKRNNERLEFLGDSLLGCIVAESLFESFPEASEGELSRLRSMLVNQDTLADIAREINLKEFVELSVGERKSGGDDRDSILADAVEAVIAAIYLDGGIEVCKKVVQQWMDLRVKEYTEINSQKDAKTRLQELMQAQGLALPEYRITEITGEPHQQTFFVECKVEASSSLQSGFGSTKRLAEQKAAQYMLAELEASG
ncbi:MAG: ribonuclease III [Gammaproteobacteria bacterium]|nr:ribonuclease III [Gammaproteobacteria bacterium]